MRKLFKKYDYNFNEIIGIKEDKKYRLVVKSKVLRKYNGKLHKPKNLVTSYINLEAALEAAYFYSFEVDKNILHKVKDLEHFIMSRAYAEAGIEKTEKYILKYSIIELKNPKKIKIECILLPETYVKLNYKKYAEDIGYLDYLSFPIFSYKVIYQEKLLEPGKDMFIVFLKDKISITVYNNGDFYFTIMISGGLKQFYNALATELEIEDFDEKLFEMILKKKGFKNSKYLLEEKPILEVLDKELSKIFNIIQEELAKKYEKYDINTIDRIFITSDYGNIPDIENKFNSYFKTESRPFDFYEKYNLDKLSISPFLYMSMLEAYHAYKFNDLYYNHSLWQRPPTFFYRASGQFVMANVLGTLLLLSYPVYLKFATIIYQNKNQELQSKINKTTVNIGISQKILKTYQNLLKEKKELYEGQLNKIHSIHDLIGEIYKFKTSKVNYETPFLTKLTELFNKFKVYIEEYTKEDNKYIISLYSDEDKNIVNLIKQLSKDYEVINQRIFYDIKQSIYKSTIKIKRYNNDNRK